MVNRLRRLPQAEEDLTDIWVNIALDSVSAADRLLERLWNAERFLCEHPLAGRNRNDLEPDLRSWPVGSYLIFYRASPGQTTVVRVLWGARNLPDLFRSDPA